jgi:hypothetical protein
MREIAMTISATTERPDAVRGRLAVPWLTVMPLAVVMAYADGFWMTSLRGAVGAIERTDAPFASWLRESTLMLPVFVFAVLGALTLALRWFGPVLRTPRTVLAAALLIVAAGTVVGIAEIAVSSAYDYGLQSSQLQLMDSMNHTCTQGGCLALQLQASLGLQVSAVGYACGILVVTNLVLVGWVVAVQGGRLDVSRTRRAARTLPQPAPATDGAHRRVDDLRRLLAAGLVGSAVIHAAVVPERLTEWAGAGMFFVVLAAVELAVAAVLLARPQPGVLLAAAIVSIGPLALWLYSRSVGMPFGPRAGVPEQVGLPDFTACALEVITLLVAVVLLRGKGRRRRRAAGSAHVSWLTLVAVIAVTAIGLAGSGGLAWFDDFGSSGDQSVISHQH